MVYDSLIWEPIIHLNSIKEENFTPHLLNNYTTMNTADIHAKQTILNYS